MGNLPRGVNPEASFGQRNPLRTCLQTGETIISDNLDEDDVWHDTPFLSNLRAKSFICMPVVINNKPIAAVLATDTEAMPTLSDEDRQAYSQISRQISIILQNLSLLNETRQRLGEVNLLLDFSRHLSGLEPREILKSLLESALRVVSPAHAGVVFLWDPNDGLLNPLAASNYADDASIMGISYHSGEGLPGRVFAEGLPRRIDDVNFAVDYNLTADNLFKYRKATGTRLPFSSMLLPISASGRFRACWYWIISTNRPPSALTMRLCCSRLPSRWRFLSKMSVLCSPPRNAPGSYRRSTRWRPRSPPACSVKTWLAHYWTAWSR